MPAALTATLPLSALASQADSARSACAYGALNARDASGATRSERSPARSGLLRAGCPTRANTDGRSALERIPL